KKYKRSIGKVILIGGGASLKGLKEAAATRFGIEVVYGDPFAKTESPAFWGPILKEVGPSFAVAAGLALRDM
ncbi:MAG: pilus assembly protein PilM, partial [Candidatus Paceibacterota bacterium]